jgi:DNA-binding response OmpR family regulator
MKPKILIVEDEPLNREFLREFLEASGYDCCPVETGEKGIEAIDREHFDLILVDLLLPGKNGAEVAWHARQKGIHVPIVAISAVLDQWEIDDLIDCGFSQTIAKPFTNEELLELVRSALRKSS